MQYEYNRCSASATSAEDATSAYTVATATSSAPLGGYITSKGTSQGTFEAQGLFWQFYLSSNVLYYAYSVDGVTWSSGGTIASGIVTTGTRFDVAYELTLNRVLVGYMTSTTAITLRAGTPQSDGSIAWASAAYTAKSGLYASGVFAVLTDSLGYTWFTGTPSSSSNHVYRGNNTDGNLGTLSVDFTTVNAGSQSPRLTELTNGKVAVSMFVSAIPYGIITQVYTGAGWTSAATSISNLNYGNINYRTVAVGDDFYTISLGGATTHYIYIDKYVYATNSWDEPTNILTGVTFGQTLLDIVYSTRESMLYAFYLNENSPTAWQYATCELGGSWTGWNTWVTDTIATDQSYCSSAMPDGYILFSYVGNSASPYNIRFTKYVSAGVTFSDFAVSSTTKNSDTILSFQANKISHPLNNGGEWIFSWDTSGTYINDTAIAYTQADEEVCSVQKTLTDIPIGTVVHWKVYGCDSSGFWFASKEQSFIVSMNVTITFSEGGAVQVNGNHIANNTVYTYSSGQTFNLTAIVNSGYGFTAWNYTGGFSTANPFVFSVSDNSVVSCTFFSYSGVFSAGNTTGYSIGWNDGNATGYATGYSNGYSAGYSAGYNAGWNAGNATGYATGYSKGFSDGWTAGWTAGYTAGWNALAAQIRAILEASHTVPPPPS